MTKTAFDQMYPENLKPHHLPLKGKRVKVTITGVRTQMFKDFQTSEEKPLFVLSLDGWPDWTLRPNPAKALARLYGRDEQRWIGVTPAIYATKVDSPNGRVDAIRVDEDLSEAADDDGSIETLRDDIP